MARPYRSVRLPSSRPKNPRDNPAMSQRLHVDLRDIRRIRPNRRPMDPPNVPRTFIRRFVRLASQPIVRPSIRRQNVRPKDQRRVRTLQKNPRIPRRTSQQRCLLPNRPRSPFRGRPRDQPKSRSVQSQRIQNYLPFSQQMRQPKKVLKYIYIFLKKKQFKTN